MLTSKDLLDKALEYDGYWNISKRMTSTESSKVRKIQLDKLLSTFNISKRNFKSTTQVPFNDDEGFKIATGYFVTGHSTSMTRSEYIKSLNSFRYFTTGEFIADADRTLYKKVLKHINEKVKQIYPTNTSNIPNHPINLVSLFSKLYSYRLSIYSTLNFGLVESKFQKDLLTEDYYSISLKKSVFENVNARLSEIDKILCLLIDPQKRKFDETEIGYVNYDFEQLDKESLIKLYS